MERLGSRKKGNQQNIYGALLKVFAFHLQFHSDLPRDKKANLHDTIMLAYEME